MQKLAQKLSKSAQKRSIGSLLQRQFSSGYTKEELMSSFSRTKLFLQPLNFMGKHNAVSINPVKAKYGFKKDYITVINNGYVYLEFMHIDQSEDGKTTLLWQQKKAFSLNLSRIGSLLALPNEIDKGYKLDLSYKVFDPKFNTYENKEMIIKKVKGEQSTNLSLRTKSEVNESYFELDISYGEMLVLQRMLDYSLPFMLGWHALESRKIAEEDLLEA